MLFHPGPLTFPWLIYALLVSIIKRRLERMRIKRCHLVPASVIFKSGAEILAGVRVFEGPRCVALAVKHATFALWMLSAR